MDTASVRRMMGVLIPELFHLDSELADREGWTCLVDAFEFAVADDLGISVHVGSGTMCVYLTGIHKFWTIIPAEIYHRKKT